jgi:hypothetical protein
MTRQYRKKVLEFTCPHCGGHDLTEISTTTIIRRIRSMFQAGPVMSREYDDETPQFTMPEHVPCPSTENATAFFLCSQCHRPLTDEDGDMIHDGSLHYWLSKQQGVKSTLSS